MQLESPAASSNLRRRLGAAACALVAAGIPTVANAQGVGNWQLDTSLLLYGEQERADVAEPVARISRLLSNGQRLSAQVGFDAITGASPSGALPSSQIQTTTTPSGSTATVPAGQVPTVPFRDNRVSLDADWQAPLGRTVQSTLGAHFSREKDYQSIGATASVSVELMQRLTTVTAGVGYNADDVFPVGGTREGLSDGSVIVNTSWNEKNVTSGMVGISRVLTRRWLVGVTGSVGSESGYLTEPYKVVSLVDPANAEVTGQVTEKRPTLRHRSSLIANSVYHLTHDILYISYRYYTDDWDLRSHTADVRYRLELSSARFLQPHVRYYTQSAARFYVPGLVEGLALPQYASSDYRLGPLNTATVGLTYGFHLWKMPGTVTLRGEYIRQWLAGSSEPDRDDEHPGDDPPGDDLRARASPAAQAALASPASIQSAAPPLNIGSLLVGYTVAF